jgi:hypothetical protein
VFKHALIWNISVLKSGLISWNTSVLKPVPISWNIYVLRRVLIRSISVFKPVPI